MKRPLKRPVCQREREGGRLASSLSATMRPPSNGRRERRVTITTLPSLSISSLNRYTGTSYTQKFRDARDEIDDNTNARTISHKRPSRGHERLVKDCSPLRDTWRDASAREMRALPTTLLKFMNNVAEYNVVSW